MPGIKVAEQLQVCERILVCFRNSLVRVVSNPTRRGHGILLCFGRALRLPAWHRPCAGFGRLKWHPISKFDCFLPATVSVDSKLDTPCYRSWWIKIQGDQGNSLSGF
jgi:hypothetical protein